MTDVNRLRKYVPAVEKNAIRGKRPPTDTASQDLYDAYLLGCEDECIPEPKTIEEFTAMWGGKFPDVGAVAPAPDSQSNERCFDCGGTREQPRSNCSQREWHKVAESCPEGLLESVHADLLNLKRELHKGRTLQADELVTFAIAKLSNYLRERDKLHGLKR